MLYLYAADFKGDEQLIVDKCKAASMQYIVVNGLEPISNREVLSLSERHPSIYLPAIGIYPLDAACNVISVWEHEFPQVRPPSCDSNTACSILCPMQLPIVTACAGLYIYNSLCLLLRCFYLV